MSSDEELCSQFKTEPVRGIWGRGELTTKNSKFKKSQKLFDKRNDGWTLQFNFLRIRRFQGRSVPICLLPIPYAILFFNFTTRLSSLSMDYFPGWCNWGFGDTRLLAPGFYITTAVARGANNGLKGKFYVSREQDSPMAECPARCHGHDVVQDGPVQTVPGSVGEITNTAKIACDKEKKARFKPRAMPESREKVITTGSQCKKGKFWDWKEIEARKT